MSLYSGNASQSGDDESHHRMWNAGVARYSMGTAVKIPRADFLSMTSASCVPSSSLRACAVGAQGLQSVRVGRTVGAWAPPRNEETVPRCSSLGRNVVNTTTFQLQRNCTKDPISEGVSSAKLPYMHISGDGQNVRPWTSQELIISKSQK